MSSSVVTVRLQHDTQAPVREFEYPADEPTGTNEQKQAEKERRAALFGFTHPRTIGALGGNVNPRQLLEMAVWAVDTRVGGWVEIVRAGRVVAAHPRERARSKGAEWVGNLGASK